MALPLSVRCTLLRLLWSLPFVYSPPVHSKHPIFETRLPAEQDSKANITWDYAQSRTDLGPWAPEWGLTQRSLAVVPVLEPCHHGARRKACLAGRPRRASRICDSTLLGRDQGHTKHTCRRVVSFTPKAPGTQASVLCSPSTACRPPFP